MAAPETLELPDGRRLAFAQYGDPRGRPVLFLHGFTASRLTRHPHDALTASLGVRLITVDRPGCGASDYQPGRTLLDFAGDAAALADHLALDRFAVAGHSAGGPYALAIAHRLPDRVTHAGVVCGFAPFDRPDATEGMRPDMARAVPGLRRMPWLARIVMASLPRQYAKDPEKAFEKQFGAGLPESDRHELARPEVHQLILDAAVESVRGGSRGLARELRLTFAEPWGFDPADIAVPTLLWYGDADVITPAQMGRHLAGAIPGSHLTVYRGEGHMVYVTHWADVLADLTGEDARRGAASAT
jgi:pimeloyl-ACP methyl ester carboxylesterase